MKLISFIALFALLVAVAVASEDLRQAKLDITHNQVNRPIVTNELVDKINSAGLGWTASLNEGSRVHGVDIDQAMKLCGALPGGPVLATRFNNNDDMITGNALPETFCSQEKWQSCPSITTILDQSACGSCWAIAAAAAITDRICITKNKNVTVSTAAIAFCCTDCGYGCQGGYPSAAWNYYKKVGVQEESCYPYPFPPCGKSDPSNPCPPGGHKTPKCPNKCTNPDYKGAWGDLQVAQSSYSICGEKDIMTEIYNNGPVEAAFSVYEDFMAYSTGVYKHVTGRLLGGHAVKIVGWGVENGQKYWHVANSWNVQWGAKGFFKILKGTNECGFEERCTAGLPK